MQLIERIRDAVGKTKYSCSIGYSYNADASETVDDMLKASDKMMYEEKVHYYSRMTPHKYVW